MQLTSMESMIDTMMGAHAASPGTGASTAKVCKLCNALFACTSTDLRSYGDSTMLLTTRELKMGMITWTYHLVVRYGVLYMCTVIPRCQRDAHVIQNKANQVRCCNIETCTYPMLVYALRYRYVLVRVGFFLQKLLSNRLQKRDQAIKLWVLYRWNAQ